MGAKYASATGRAERGGEGLGKDVRPPPPQFLSYSIHNSRILSPGTKTEPPAARATRAMTAQLHVRGRAPAVGRQRVNFHAGAGAGVV